MSASKALELLPPPPLPNRSLMLKPPPPVPTPSSTKLSAKTIASAPKVTRTTRRRRGLCRSNSTGGKRRGSVERGLSRLAGRGLGDLNVGVGALLERPSECLGQLDAGLVEHDQRGGLDQHGDGVGARQ